ncbi:ATP-binding protein [Rhizobium leguminosarum]|uniref:ATP-binding protein n=1 Tax=Rhizobium leguminosarum TaxID=384 RepID=UPI001A9297CA|nr:ATP-binding protein [Rhizobium leguminosarum]MBY5557344.1 ATP-binding protein [Rhizobium leguminosarum]MBY5633362.1 ATP-binding protein [Rhizobium leguminosarum]MBY5687788.1 ATP-binding protein [Rhizobium leguminosarum]MBY5726996.1 ATP-binding protein [Rhizobium leguminosarum]MBY5742293.1 ATP-binding protein [Rhizobium leguminosarum]
MLNNDLRMSGKAGEHDRRDGHTPGNRFLGRVVACSGSRATIAAVAEQGGTDLTELWSVGRLISISVGRNRVVALVYQMNTGSHAWGEGEDNIFKIETELLGEVRVDEDGREEFSTGISRYPYLGAIAHRIRSADLMRIYDAGEGTTAVIGKLTQDESIDAAIHIPSMLSKHFAVVGSTGVGKSTAVSLLLHKAIAADPKLRVLILDPHNEFAAAFPQHAVTIDTDTLDLPFWLMRLEEFAEVVFRGRPPVPEELDMLRDILPEAKRAFRGSDNSLVRRTTEKSSITADTPVPYRMADLLALIDERIGRLEGRSEKPFLRSLKMRLIAAINDPRYHFMFSNNTISDTITETIAQIFRIPGENRPICTFQLAGIPSEVVNSVASVLCRMAFEVALWSDGAIHMLVVCEEAHRYIPSDPSLGFVPTRQAIARIAKEGRKYGVSLGIITQRPGELDQTILSQCSTLFAMRLANDRDQEIIRSAIPNSSISTTSFISSIGNGEAIAFGEAISVPMRMRFSRVDEKLLPKASSANSKQSEEDPDTVDLRKIVTRMRAVTVGPDISNFQQNYAASVGFDEADPADEDIDAKPYAPPASSVAPLESYRRELLPQTPRLDPATSPAIDPRLDALRREMRRDEPVFPRPTPPADQPAVSRREPGTSLRESILKKPLSSLYNKD